MGFGETFVFRFWKYVDKSGPIPSHQKHLGKCWTWTGGLRAKNRPYGCAYMGGRRKIGAHQASWIMHFGPIPTELCVCHRCDNPKCVNPNHLFLGTHEDNSGDMCKKGRCKRAKLTPAQVREIRSCLCVTPLALAKKYAVSRTTIYGIINCRIWRSLLRPKSKRVHSGSHGSRNPLRAAP